MLIAAAEPVRPLESFFELFRQESDLTLDKEVALSLNVGSIVCLCNAPPGRSPEVLRQFTVESLRYTHHDVLINDVRWTVVSDQGRIWEGNTNQVDFYKGLMVGGPDLPIRHCSSKYGVRVVFKFRIPSSYRLHHYSYLQRYFPGALDKLAA